MGIVEHVPAFCRHGNIPARNVLVEVLIVGECPGEGGRLGDIPAG
eukprot:CAMPEP_0172582042 /NCGR_PEP_ID=MMETSP1068-20121228/1460_1 /TAXON_ID=35684 /ORGANISM="Pseudopedinella elastica, Strain CCMP716" /LENGTH=44 /DNA_ID= /DNA_START= /DNA_END= /DNA_ORIENTATION=